MITTDNIYYITEEHLDLLDDAHISQLLELSEDDRYGFPTVRLGDGTEWLILDECQRTIAVALAVEESIEHFTPDFLASITDLPATLFEALQKSNIDTHEAVVDLIDKCGLSWVDVAEEAMSWDGAGHFLATYDGEEQELFKSGLYAYRID